MSQSTSVVLAVPSMFGKACPSQLPKTTQHLTTQEDLELPALVSRWAPLVSPIKKLYEALFPLKVVVVL